MARFIGKLIIGLFAGFGVILCGLILLGYFALKTFFGGIEPDIPDQGYLAITLDAPLPEKGGGFSFLRSADAGFDLPLVIETLDQAAVDPRILGIVAYVSTSGRTIAQTQELRDAIHRFRQSGKPAIAFSPGLGGMGPPFDVYLTAAFDEVWLQPTGTIDFTGYAVEQPFFRKALESIGISVEHGARKEYKDAFDSVVRDTMSEAQRESLRSYLSALRKMVTEGIAADRQLPLQDVEDLNDGFPLLAQEARDAGIVTHLGYWDEVVASLKNRDGIDTLIPFSDYALQSQVQARFADSGKMPFRAGEVPIAYIVAEGGIVERAGGMALNSTEVDAWHLAQAIRDAANDPAIAAIVLRISSPGGSYVASDMVWREVKRAQDNNVPVIVSMGGVAASGGYLIALPATRIVALPGTLTGSIGVLSLKPVTEGLWDKLGVSWETVREGQHTTMWSAVRPFTEDERQWFNRHLDVIYSDFTARVAEGRGLSKDQVDKAARGRVWMGAEAKALGLVDVLGGYTTAIIEAKKAAGYPEDAPYVLVPFPEQLPEWQQVLSFLQDGHLLQAVQSFSRIMGTLVQVGGPVVRSVERQMNLSAEPQLMSPVVPEALW